MAKAFLISLSTVLLMGHLLFDVEATDLSCLKPEHHPVNIVKPCKLTGSSKANMRRGNSKKIARMNLTVGVDVSPFTIYNVTSNMIQNPKTGTFTFYRNDKFEICFAGKATGLGAPIVGLQTSLHTVAYVGRMKVELDHCGFNKDTCAATSPPCGSIMPGYSLVPNQDFCTCGTFTIPKFAFSGVQVRTTINILGLTAKYESGCEKADEPVALARKRKMKLFCSTVLGNVRAPRGKKLDQKKLKELVKQFEAHANEDTSDAGSSSSSSSQYSAMPPKQQKAMQDGGKKYRSMPQKMKRRRGPPRA